jgi:hypothetical protein
MTQLLSSANLSLRDVIDYFRNVPFPLDWAEPGLGGAHCRDGSFQFLSRRADALPDHCRAHFSSASAEVIHHPDGLWRKRLTVYIGYWTHT